MGEATHVFMLPLVNFREAMKGYAFQTPSKSDVGTGLLC